MSRANRTDPRSAIEAQRRRIAVTGVEAAVTALIGVCEDPKAPAPAKATAGTSLLRAAGMLDRNADALREKDQAEMTPEELTQAIADIVRKRDAALAELSDDEASDIFG